MTYSKPEIYAQNASTGSYAAGCPMNQHKYGDDWWVCQPCEIAR